MPQSAVRELRLALTVEDYDQAVAFYRDGLGLPVVELFEGPDGGGVVLDAGRATLEVLSVRQAEMVDRVEVGSRVAGPVRVGRWPRRWSPLGGTATSASGPPTGCSSPCSPCSTTPAPPERAEHDGDDQLLCP